MKIESRPSERGMSLIAILVIVVLVGGIASAFFILSQTESLNAEVARNRSKSYYLGEAAIEQVGAMLKVGATSFLMPPNPADPTSPPNSKMSGVLTINGVTSNWAFQHYDTASGTWVPQWNRTTSQWPSTPAWNSTSYATITVGTSTTTDPSNLRLCLVGTATLQLEPSSIIANASNTETFNYTITNFQNITGTGTGNTGVKNYYTIAVEGRVQHYDVAGSVAHGTNIRGTNVSLTRAIELNNQSLLPFFAFFNNDLEFLPGPPFVGNGKVHTNGDLYLGGGHTIDLNSDYIGAVGQMYRHRKNNGSYTDNPGVVTLHNPIPGTPAPGAIGTGSAIWSESVESATVSGGTVTPNSSWASQISAAGLSPTLQQGASQMATPDVGSIQPPATSGGTGGTYYEWAKNPSSGPGGTVGSGLIISVDTAGTPTVTFNGTQLSSSQVSTLTSSGAITTTQIADNRQSMTAYVPTTTVDVGKLTAAGYYPSNGILYATDARNGTPTVVNGNLAPPSPPPTIPAGFVFTNGKNLTAPVNIVSNGPVYVKGDFNSPDPTNVDPVTLQPLYTKQAAAVIADAVNLLSNQWGVSSTKAPGGAMPRASETSYNFALVTGNVPTIAGVQYSGGLENLPRFHEDWSNINCNYRGSLINMWASAIATGVWGQGNSNGPVYSPPNRNWDWDSAFGTTGTGSKIPGFPRAISIDRTIYTMDYWGAGGNSAYRAAQ